MSIRLESITFRNPSPSLNRAAASMALCRAPPASLGFEALSRTKIHFKASIPALLKVVGIDLRRTSVRKRSVFSFAASHEESKASDIDMEKEKEDLKVGAQESQEVWQQALANIKQALKMESKEEARILLKETSKKLDVAIEKSRENLVAIAKEIAEESKDYLTTAAASSPEPVKEIVETFASSTDEFKDVSKVRDFYVGIPYGGLLSVGGFISFMITGSIPAIRFGIILGGTLLALSISSLRSWKKGEFSPLVLKGQTAIATVLFLRELRLLSMRPFIANFVSVLISGGVLAFYLYRIIRDGELRGSNPEISPEN